LIRFIPSKDFELAHFKKFDFFFAADFAGGAHARKLSAADVGAGTPSSLSSSARRRAGSIYWVWPPLGRRSEGDAVCPMAVPQPCKRPCLAPGNSRAPVGDRGCTYVPTRVMGSAPCPTPLRLRWSARRRLTLGRSSQATIRSKRSRFRLPYP